MRPTIDKLYYNDRATTGEIEAGPMEVQFFFLPDSTHLVLWTADRAVENYDNLYFTTISSPRYIVYNWHTGLPVAMCPSTVDYTDRYSKAWQQYELRMQYCKNPLEIFCKPDQLPVVDKNPNDYLHSYTTIGNGRWASTSQMTSKTAYAAIGTFYNGDMQRTQKSIGFQDAIPYSKPAICPGLPVCAVLNKTEMISYEDHMMRARIEIVNIETGEKISSLVNWREYQKYQDVVNKHLADSIAMDKIIAGIRSEGWSIEKIKHGMEPGEDIYSGGDKFGIWDFTPSPNRIYSFLALSTTSDLTSWPVADRQSDKSAGMRSKYFQNEYLNDLDETSLKYMVSDALYNSKPNDPVFFGSGFRCRGAGNDCLKEEMADSNNLLRLLISHEKPEANEIAIKAIDKTLKILEVQATYIAAVKQIKQNEADWAAEEKEKIKKEKLEEAKAKQNVISDGLNRKNFLATLKKKYATPERKVRQEIVKTEVKGDNKIDLNTAFDESLKRIVVVMTNGENNELVILDGDDDGKLINPGTAENMNGYTVSRFSFYNKSKKISLGMTKNQAADYTILVMTEKNDKAYAAYKKGVSEVQEANEKANSEAREKRDLAYYKENSENDERVKKIRRAYESLASEMTSLYNNANQNGENWTLSKQIEEFNKARNLVAELKSNVDRNIPSGFLSGNPSAASYKKWFTTAQTYFNDINEKLTKLSNEIDDRKARNALYAAKPLLPYIFYLPLQDMMDLAKKFNSHLNSDNPK